MAAFPAAAVAGSLGPSRRPPAGGTYCPPGRSLSPVLEPWPLGWGLSSLHSEPWLCTGPAPRTAGAPAL
eukprot:1476142-Heterocapsa_arctica.AAC.1